MFGKRFETELHLIDAALIDERAEERLRQYLATSVKSIVEEYIVQNDLGHIPREQLLQAGWTHFHVALKRYKGRAELMLQGKNDIYYFITYFAWFIRQGILEYRQAEIEK